MIVELQFDNVASQPQNVPGLHNVSEDVFHSCVKEIFLLDILVHITLPCKIHRHQHIRYFAKTAYLTLRSAHKQLTKLCKHFAKAHLHITLICDIILTPCILQITYMMVYYISNLLFVSS